MCFNTLSLSCRDSSAKADKCNPFKIVRNNTFLSGRSSYISYKKKIDIILYHKKRYQIIGEKDEN